MKIFPARAPPIEGESLYSLVRRTTEAMGYDTNHRVLAIAKESGKVPFWLNELRDAKATQRLTKLFGVTPETVRDLTIHRYAVALGSTVEETLPQYCDSKTRLRFFTPNARICPLCLRENSIEKLIWSFRPLPICVRHQCRLAGECPHCGKRISNSRLTNRNCQCGHDLGLTASEPLGDSVASISQSVESVIESQSQYFGGANATFGLRWLERITAAVRRCILWSETVSMTLRLPESLPLENRCWVVAAYTLQDWPDRFCEFLDVFVRQPKYRSTSTGVSRRFGRLLREASSLEEMGCPVVADVLRDYLARRYTAGHVNAKICLFENSASRDWDKGEWLTQTAAAHAMKTNVSTIRRLVSDGILEGEINDAGNRGRTVGVVSRQSLDLLRREIATSVSCQEAGQRLGMGRHRILQLIHSGLLPRSVQVANSWKIPLDAVRTIEALVEKSPCVNQRSTGWCSVRHATRRHGRIGLTNSEILRLLMEGVLRAARIKQHTGFDNLLLSDADLDQCLPGVRHRHYEKVGVPLDRLAQTLFPDRPTKDRVLKRFIELNLLPAKRESREWRVQVAEVKRFQEAYCLADEAAQILDRSRATLARWETEGRITPVYGKRVTPGAGFSLYRRDDVQQLLAVRDSTLPLDSANLTQQEDTQIERKNVV